MLPIRPLNPPKNEADVQNQTVGGHKLTSPSANPNLHSPNQAFSLPTRGTSVKLSVPPDTDSGTITTTAFTATANTRTLIRRDSLERREALLKGKEGSRQRRRWENDRLLSNPWAVPPLPSDWQIHPTYPRRTVPYYLAPLWDAAEFQRAVESKLHSRRHRHSSSNGSFDKNTIRSIRHRSHNSNAGMSPMEEAATHIPKEVRARLKHVRSAKGLLKDLEEGVREFVLGWNQQERELLQDREMKDINHTHANISESDEDEEIVFSGRNSTPQVDKYGTGSSYQTQHNESLALQSKRKLSDQNKDDEATIIHQKLMLTALDNDKSASFARWLVHSLGAYYGLRTWSITTEREIWVSDRMSNTATGGAAGGGARRVEKRREAYVGVDSRARGFRAGRGRGREGTGTYWNMDANGEIELPQPLWGMV